VAEGADLDCAGGIDLNYGGLIIVAAMSTGPRVPGAQRWPERRPPSAGPFSVQVAAVEKAAKEKQSAAVRAEQA
jgi:hypothetical protein